MAQRMGPKNITTFYFYKYRRVFVIPMVVNYTEIITYISYII